VVKVVHKIYSKTHMMSDCDAVHSCSESTAI